MNDRGSCNFSKFTELGSQVINKNNSLLNDLAIVCIQLALHYFIIKGYPLISLINRSVY
jgi:hypothetical protein